MQTTLETIEVLNDLIMINKHWISGYEEAIKELRAAEQELTLLHYNLLEQSKLVTVTEDTEVKVYSGAMQWGHANNKIIFKAWMEIKAIFSGVDKHMVLSAARKVQSTAFAVENLPSVLHEMIEKQKAILKSSQREILGK